MHAKNDLLVKKLTVKEKQIEKFVFGILSFLKILKTNSNDVLRNIFI